MKHTLPLLAALLLAPLAALSAFAAETPRAAPVVPKDIKAYCLDFNWGPGGPNGFAKPGLWADADPAQHVAWYRAMGVNVIQTFCVSCNGIVWLTCCDIHDPHIAHSRALKQTDWLLNEAGDLQRTAHAKKMIGPHTRLITCLANWNQQDPMQIVPAALTEGIGLYGFTRPGPDSLLPLEAILARPVSELKGDEKNIAVLARAFHGVSAKATKTPDGRFVEPKGE